MFSRIDPTILRDDIFSWLTFPNAIITGHQAFFTAEALAEIARTTIASVSEFETSGTAAHRVILA